MRAIKCKLNFIKTLCGCGGVTFFSQPLSHLLLQCSKLASAHDIMRQKLKKKEISLRDLLCDKQGVKVLCEFLERSHIVRRKWI